MKVLIACEESQEVCKAFRARGHEAYSCDIIEPSGGHPEWHIQENALELIDGKCLFVTLDGKIHSEVARCEWDIIIAHPPCTYLTVSGNRRFNVDKYSDKALLRYEKREQAFKFFMAFVNAKCAHIAIENPVGYISTAYRKPDQIIQPYQFGHKAEKKTCLWLKGLPKLVPTNEVKPPERVKFASGKSMPKWIEEAWNLPKEERSKIRSRTFPGIAQAMAEQWGVI